MVNMLVRYIGLLSVVNAALLVTVQGVHILAVFPHSLRSRLSLGEILIEELIARGHKVTIVSQLDVRIQHENITKIRLNGVSEHLHDLGFTDTEYQNRRIHYVNEELISTVHQTTALMNYILGHDRIQTLINGPAIYDLLLIDFYFSDSLLGLAYHWKIPVVALCADSANKWSNEMVGNPHKPAYNPSIYTEHSDRMTILQRLFNALESAFEDITYNYMYLPAQEAIFKRYFEIFLPKKRVLPPLIDLIHNVSLVLLNTHPAIHYPRPYVPNIIQIGGIHLNRKTTVLPENLETFINEATDGVILMSFGNTEHTDFPSDLIDVFTRVFASLAGQMNVIWKWDDASLKNHSDNMFVEPWLPQQAILAHSNVRLFISNGGIFSVMEAVHYGVPIIGIPLFGDQPHNIALIENRGFGIKLDINTINETMIRNAINKILTNSEYQQNAINLGQLFRDNAIDPLEHAIYQIEYVLRTNGAKHLRSASVDLPMWQQNLIDVWLIILVAIAIILAIPATFICILLRRTHAANKDERKDSGSIKKLQQIESNKKKMK